MSRSLRRHLQHSGLPIGGIAVALMLSTSALLDVPVSMALLGAAFCGTALVYLADRALGHSPEDAINRPDRVTWRRSMRGWIAGEGMALAVGLAVCLPFLHGRTLLGAMGIGTVAGLHVGVPGHDAWRLKRWGRLKPLAISGAWAVGAVLLPVLEADAPWALGVGALIAYRLALILPNVLMADWRDRPGDAVHGVSTLSYRWQRRTVQHVGWMCLGLATLGALLVAGRSVALAPLLVVDAVGLLLMGVALHRLRPRHTPMHMIVLDVLVAWPLVTWIVARVLA